jgi:hypothetical protein
MPFDAPRPAWWRLPTPSCLIVVLLLSLLPWIEVGCESKLDMNKQLEGFGGGKATLTPGFQGGKQIILTQSGVQVSYGGYSKSGILADLPEGDGMGPGGAKSQPGGAKKDIEAAPLMFLFFVAVLAGIVIGFAMPPGRLRLILVGACVASAVIVLLLQAMILGFPVANDVAKELKNPAPNQGGMMGDNAVTMFVRYTPAYWITWVVLIGSLVPLVLEELLAPKQRLAGSPPESGSYAERFRPIDADITKKEQLPPG